MRPNLKMHRPDPEAPTAVNLPRPGPDRRFRPGDVLLFYGHELVSRAISLCTWGPSHVGIIGLKTEMGEPLLVESTTLCDLPDAFDGSVRKGVQFQRPWDRIAAYDGQVYRMRLVDGWWLWQNEVEWLDKLCRGIHGRPYDLEGAAFCEVRKFRLGRLLPYPDRGSLFCSELVAGLLMRLGRLPLSNPSSYSPASLARTLQSCGVYARPQILKR